MNAVFLHSIDWHRPWLTPYRQTGEMMARTADWRAEINTLAADIRNSRGLPIQFVQQSSLPAGTAYEAFINATGKVPTRENLHDFFNALVWLSFPRLKAQLNARQAAEIEQAGNGGAARETRGSVRDAATIFDENAALLIVRDAELLDALRSHNWSEAFLKRREQFHHNCEVFLFGHALMEKLAAPYKAITAHAWPVVADDAYFDLSDRERCSWLDATLAEQIAGRLTTTCFTPLPVLGIPGWWAGQDQAFYSDTTVFRLKRR
jgi:hypothetical protein